MAEDSKDKSEEETEEVEVIEIALNEDEIDSWIGQLVELKETKKETTLELDDENEILIKYDDSEPEENKDGSDEEGK